MTTSGKVRARPARTRAPPGPRSHGRERHRARAAPTGNEFKSAATAVAAVHIVLVAFLIVAFLEDSEPALPAGAIAAGSQGKKQQ